MDLRALSAMSPVLPAPAPPSRMVAAARRRLPPTVIALGVTSLCTDVASEMIFPLLPVFVASLGAAPVFLGLVEGLATSPWHVLAVRVSDRVGKGIRSTPRDVLLASSVSNEESGRAFGFHRAMDHAGAVLGPLVATLLMAMGFSMRQVFVAALVPGVLSVLAVLSVREVPPLDEPPAAARDAVRDAVHEAKTLPVPLRRYLAILALFSLGNSSDAFLLLRAREVGISIGSLPLLWSLFHVVKVISSSLGGTWADRLPRRRLIVAGWLVYAATYLAFGLATQPMHMWGLFVVYGTYYGLTEPAEKALVKDLAPPSMRGRAYGAYNFILGASAVPAGLLTGVLWQSFGPLVALATGAALAAVASLAILVSVREARTA